MASSSSTETRRVFAQQILQSQNDLSVLQRAFEKAPGNDNDKKSIFEQSFRDVIRELLTEEGERENEGVEKITSCASLIDLAISSAESQICYHSVPFLILSDAFDSITLDLCESLFDAVESHVTTWTKPDFFSSGKILLLRMCNDLLRRLSSSQNTVFCGRIQLFLARLFPLSEKSALNLMSHFNLENITMYNKKTTTTVVGNEVSERKEPSGEEGEEMEVDQPTNSTTASEQPIDYNLYEKLWALQDFFRQPTQCFNPDNWKRFISTVQEVLQSFSSYKLESIPTRKRLHPSSSNVKSNLLTFTSSHYFAKYLTSENLVNLQLSDSHFRRHVLIQLLILIQYLTGDVKFKSSSQVLSDSQSSWIKETQSTIYVLLNETPPNGKSFTEYIKLVLQREETWIAWKNDGCPSFEKPQLAAGASAKVPSKQIKERLGEKIYKTKEDKDIGGGELSRLWNLCPDNLEACSSPERIFVPSLDVFLEEPLEQTKENCQVPKDDKFISNPNFRWQALRLLSRESTHFFPYANHSAIKPLEEYLEQVIVQTCKDMPSSS